jgi:hypothetical protein
MSIPDPYLARMIREVQYHKLSRWGKLKLKLKQWILRLKFRLMRRNRHRKNRLYNMPISDIAGEELARTKESV